MVALVGEPASAICILVIASEGPRDLTMILPSSRGRLCNYRMDRRESTKQYLALVDRLKNPSLPRNQRKFLKSRVKELQQELEEKFNNDSDSSSSDGESI